MGTTAYCARESERTARSTEFPTPPPPDIPSEERRAAGLVRMLAVRSMSVPYGAARPGPSADGHVPAWTNVSETAGSPNAPARETRAQARRRSRATRTASPVGRRIVRDGTRPRSRSASEGVAADSGSAWSVRAARSSATSAMAAAERAARRGAGSDTRERSPETGGGSGACRVTTWGRTNPTPYRTGCPIPRMGHAVLPDRRTGYP